MIFRILENVERFLKNVEQKVGRRRGLFNLCFSSLNKKRFVMSTLEFNQLLVSQSDFLRGFALGFTRNGADADDLVQDTMVKALRYKTTSRRGPT